MRSILPALLTGLVAGLPMVVLAQSSSAAAVATPPADAGRLRAASLAAQCAACHGTEGRASPRSVVPGLAGRPSAELREALFAFKQDRRGATVMQQITKGYTDAQLEQLADWFAARPAAR